MPRYFIDLRDVQGMIHDEEGAEFVDLADALKEATASARELIKQYIDNRMTLTETCIEIRDTKGETVATLTASELLEHPVHPEFKHSCSDIPRAGHR